MYNPGDIVKIIATEEMIRGIGAHRQLNSGQEVKVLKFFPDGWIVVEGELCGIPCEADVPQNFLQKV